MQERLVKRLMELFPFWKEYEDIKEELRKNAIETGERYKDDFVSVTLENRPTFKPKHTIEQLKDIMPMAVVTETKEVIDIELLKSLENYDEYLEVENKNIAKVTVKKQK